MSQPMTPPGRRAHHELFPHGADIGVRGFGPTPASAFAQAALAMVSVITPLRRIRRECRVAIACEADTPHLLLFDWLNAILREMATRRMLFSAFRVVIRGQRLTGTAHGEPVVPARHAPAVEVKAATFHLLQVQVTPDGGWRAQCVVDV